MFIGHYGVAFALKRAEPRVSLGTLFIAVQLVDILWGGTLLLGWEHARVVPGYMPASALEFLDYPITHSLLAVVCWGAAAALLYFSWPTRNVTHHWRAALIVGLAVLSHWPLDLLMHARDLPLAGNDSARFGLGLWRSVPATLAIEIAILAAGATLYATLRSRRHPLRPVPFAVLLGVLLVTFVSSMFSAPPANMRYIGVGAIAVGVLMAALAWWVDRPAAEVPTEHRHPVKARHAA